MDVTIRKKYKNRISTGNFLYESLLIFVQRVSVIRVPVVETQLWYACVSRITSLC